MNYRNMSFEVGSKGQVEISLEIMYLYQPGMRSHDYYEPDDIGEIEIVDRRLIGVTIRHPDGSTKMLPVEFIDRMEPMLTPRINEFLNHLDTHQHLFDLER